MFTGVLRGTRELLSVVSSHVLAELSGNHVLVGIEVATSEMG